MFDAGLNIVAFYIIVPYPGTVLYDYAVANNHLPKILDLPNMKFAIPTMINTKVSPDILHYTRRMVYQLINNEDRIKQKHDKNVRVILQETTNSSLDFAKVSGRDLTLGIN